MVGVLDQRLGDADGIFAEQGGATPVADVAQVAIFTFVTADGNRILGPKQNAGEPGTSIAGKQGDQQGRHGFRVPGRIRWSRTENLWRWQFGKGTRQHRRHWPELEVCQAGMARLIVRWHWAAGHRHRLAGGRILPWRGEGKNRSCQPGRGVLSARTMTRRGSRISRMRCTVSSVDASSDTITSMSE